MTNTLTKLQVADAIIKAGTPLTKSAIKKTSLAALSAQYDAIVRDVQMPAAETPAFSTKRSKPAPKPPSQFKRESGKAADVKPVKAGTKRAALLDALFVGTTVELCAELFTKADGTMWTRNAQRAALTTFFCKFGYGVEQHDDAFKLILPEGLDAPLITAEAET